MTGPTSVGGRSGANGYRQFFAGDDEMEVTYGGYDGPFPPWNDERTHRYRFRVLALDVPALELEQDFGLEDFRQAAEGHVIDEGELVGTYSLSRNGGRRRVQSSEPHTTPPTTSPWPPSYFVALCRTSAAPCAAGFWSTGVANVLSTSTGA